MTTKQWLAALTAVVGVLAAVPAVSQPQAIRETFVHLGPGVPSVLYEPVVAGPKSGTAVFVMHSSGDYLQFSACTELSKRGYRVLCANSTTSKSGDENDLDMDQVLLDAKLGVAWLRKRPGVRKIVLLGHSGGGVLMSSYQAIAEGGVQACQGPEKLVKCPAKLAGLPPADGVILLDANYGISSMTLFSLDPAVLDQHSGLKRDPALDLWNPQNGFSPQGAHYSDAFAHRYQAAVARRNNQLIAAALARLKLIEAGQGEFLDNEPFYVAGANYNGHDNKFFSQDPRFLSHTRNAWPLLHKGGAVTTEVVHTVRQPENLTPTTGYWFEGALKSTVHRFLSTDAVRVSSDFGFDEDSIHGVDWESSYAVPASSVRKFSVPLLTMGMTAHWEYLNAEIIYENAHSADKSIAFVEGANHDFSPCAPCAKSPGEFGDTVKTLYDYVDGWLSKPGRFQ